MSKLVWYVWIDGTYEKVYTEKEAEELAREAEDEGYDDVKIEECWEF